MDMTSCFNGMFGKLGPGMCRLTMNGKIAVKTSGGYKSYNVTTGRLTNCSNFVFNIGDDFFFIIPTNKVDVGDIILVKGKPQCVIEVDQKTLKVMNYEDMTIEELQEAILEKMRKNGPVTDYMLGTVRDNTHHGSLVSWVRSFQ